MPPVVAVVGAVAASIQAGFAAIAASSLFTTLSFSSVIGFLSSPIGQLALGVGLKLVGGLFAKKPKGGQAPAIEAGKITVRVEEPERWLFAGRARSGGAVVFAEFDDDGAFWYVIVHSDTLLNSTVQYYFDDVPVEIDSSNRVTTDEFNLDTSYNSYDGSGTAVPYFTIWTTTYTSSDPKPPAIAALKTAFSEWTDDHVLAGTTYSVVKIDSIPTEHRYKIYKWRGPVGTGEPALTIVGDWADIYDPRTGLTGASRNPVLIWAWFRTHKYGRGKDHDDVNWTKVIEQANICDEIVKDKNGVSHYRYLCGLGVPESKERWVGEQEILTTCDAQLVFDDDGKVWPRVGYYYSPSLTLTRNRDIMAMESIEAVDGESETQGVIVRYTDPANNWSPASSAPWKNPNYYVEGETPKYLTVDVMACQDHNQALRLAKSIGMRSQPLHKLAPTTGLRGIKARQERIIKLEYDSIFTGDYEIATPVEVDESGAFCGFGIVPVDSSRWVLNSDEEGDQPKFDAIVTSNTPVLPTSVVLSYDGAVIMASFDARPRDDHIYDFEYRRKGTTTWLPMTVDYDANEAVTETVVSNDTYELRWQTLTSSGKSSGYISPVQEVNTTIITITGTPVTTATVGVAYAGFTVSASGGQTPYVFSDLYDRLPPGITIDSGTGVVSGTPTTSGTYSNIYLRVVDFNQAYDTLSPFTIEVT